MKDRISWLILSLLLLVTVTAQGKIVKEQIKFSSMTMEVQEKTVALGDINGDGKQEFARIERSAGAGAYFDKVSIISRHRTLLTIPQFNGNTADGYRVVGRQIVVWRGDWLNTQSKWEPHFYDFTWYSWETKRKQYVQVREGFTKSRFEYQKAEKEMPQLAVKPGRGLIRSQSVSFTQDAIAIGSKKLGKHFRRAEAVEWPPTSKPYARCYILDQAVYVNFRRDGTYVIIVMDTPRS